VSSSSFWIRLSKRSLVSLKIVNPSLAPRTIAASSSVIFPKANFISILAFICASVPEFKFSLWIIDWA
jgi:hypothetical protein